MSIGRATKGTSGFPKVVRRNNSSIRAWDGDRGRRRFMGFRAQLGESFRVDSDPSRISLDLRKAFRERDGSESASGNRSRGRSGTCPTGVGG